MRELNATTLNTKGETPPSLDSRTAVVAGRQLVVLGKARGKPPYFGCYRLSVEKKSWIRIDTSREEAMVPRVGFCAVAGGCDSILIFGGYGDKPDLFFGGSGRNSGPLADMWRLDVLNGTFKMLLGHSDKRCFTGACTARLGFIVYRFGGLVDGIRTNSVHTNIIHAADGEHPPWRQLKATGNAPEPRTMASMLARGNSLFVFGGWGETQQLNDLHELDTKSKSWSKIKTIGTSPYPRIRAAVVELAGLMLVCGGGGDLALYDFATRRWQVKDGTPQQAASFRVMFDENSILQLPHNWEAAALVNGRDEVLVSGDKEVYKIVPCGFPITDPQPKAQTQVQAQPKPKAAQVQAQPKAQTQRRKSPRKGNKKTMEEETEEEEEEETDEGEKEKENSTSKAGGLAREMWEKRLFTDVEFLVDGQRIPAHRVICSNSPHLLSLLQHAGSAPEIQISDVSASVFLVLLEYIYTEELNMKLLKESDNDLIELLEAADRFQTDGLKASVENRLIGKINNKNCCDLLVTGHRFNLRNLEGQAGRHVCGNLKSVAKTEGFNHLAHPSLAKAIERHPL